MTKSKRFRSHQKPLKVGFSLQERESNQRLGETTNKEVKTSFPGPNGEYDPGRCTSLLAPRNFRTAGEYEKSESEESPEMSEQCQVKPNESPCKATEKSEESPFIQPGSSFPHQGSLQKSGQLSENSKNTFQTHAKRTKTHCKAAEKSEKDPGPKSRNASRKYSSSPASHSRIIGGGSRAPNLESSKFKNQSLGKLTKTLGKAAGKPENQFSQSSFLDTRSARRGSCVSFHDPVAAEITYYDSPLRNWPSSQPDHSIAQKETPNPAVRKCSCPKREEPPKKKSLRDLCMLKYKIPVIVVPSGEGILKDHKEKTTHRTSSSSSLQIPVRPPQDQKEKSNDKTSSLSSQQNPARPQNCSASQKPRSMSSSNSKLKSYIPYSRSSFYHVDSLSNIHVCRSERKKRNPSPSVPSAPLEPSAPQCATKSTSCNDCTEVSRQIRQLFHKIQCLEATVSQMSEKREKVECLKLEKKLSTCEFCRGRNLPILHSFMRQLKEAIGRRSCTEVVISIFLRADNIYHVNLRDLKSGSSLACFLVTDDAIMEVQKCGLFREILTFCVIDVRNTLKPKNCALGITFELVDPERQKGGCDAVNQGLCLTCKPFLARILGHPLHRLRHVYTDPAIINNYMRKSLKEKISKT